jgi:hypothetical protein
LNKYAGQNAPTGSAVDIDSLADDLYTEFVGPNTPSDTQGIGMQQLFDMFHKVGLHYQTIGSTELNFQVDQLTPQVALEWLHAGYPIICSVAETSVFDFDLGGTPYKGWTPSGYHVITLVGISDDGNVLVSDPASVPVNERPFPRRYRLSDLKFVSMVAVALPWQPQQPPELGGGMMGIPAGWHDDGATLTAPNGHKVVKGFRQYLLTHPWDPNNWPLEEEHWQNPLEENNPSLGGGSQQTFSWTVLEWDQQRNVQAMYVGKELLFLRNELAALRAKLQ